jgi:hypothetical protein
VGDDGLGQDQGASVREASARDGPQPTLVCCSSVCVCVCVCVCLCGCRCFSFALSQTQPRSAVATYSGVVSPTPLVSPAFIVSQNHPLVQHLLRSSISMSLAQTQAITDVPARIAAFNTLIASAFTSQNTELIRSALLAGTLSVYLLVCGCICVCLCVCVCVCLFFFSPLHVRAVPCSPCFSCSFLHLFTHQSWKRSRCSPRGRFSLPSRICLRSTPPIPHVRKLASAALYRSTARACAPLSLLCAW